MAGQGTIGLEFLDQVPTLDAIVVPVSGGGMVSGACTAVPPAAICAAQIMRTCFQRPGL